MNKTAILFLLLGAVLLTGLFLLLRPAPEDDTVAAPAPAGSAGIAAVPVAPPKPAVAVPATVEIEWVVQDGQRQSGPERVELRAGDEVVLTLRSDRDDELHVHGYDLHTHLRAGEPATLRFTADRSGRFECELHKSHLALGVLEVLPR